MIKGKVIDILDDRTVVINVGTDNKVKQGMFFQILQEDGKEIRNPESGEILGKVKISKIKVSVTQVEKNFSVAETYEYETVNVGGINTLESLGNLLTPPKYVKKYKTFDIDEQQKKKITQEQSVVKIGDTVEEIKESNN